MNLHNHNVKINKWKLKSAFDNERKKSYCLFFVNEMKTKEVKVKPFSNNVTMELEKG